MFIHQVFLTQSLFYLQLVWKPREKQKHLNSECFFIVIWLKVIFIYLACSVKILLIILSRVFFKSTTYIHILYIYFIFLCYFNRFSQMYLFVPTKLFFMNLSTTLLLHNTTILTVYFFPSDNSILMQPSTICSHQLYYMYFDFSSALKGNPT